MATNAAAEDWSIFGGPPRGPTLSAPTGTQSAPAVEDWSMFNGAPPRSTLAVPIGTQSAPPPEGWSMFNGTPPAGQQRGVDPSLSLGRRRRVKGRRRVALIHRYSLARRRRRRQKARLPFRTAVAFCPTIPPLATRLFGSAGSAQDALM
jgi:hypothetical protein